MSDRYHEKIETVKCPCLPGGHALLEKALMCTECDALSDDMGSFKKETCRRSGQTPSMVPSNRSTTSSGDESDDSQVFQVQKAMEALRLAEAQVKQLQLLKELERERIVLQELMAKRSNTTSFLIENCSMSYA